jgi:hypothetical protein
VLELGRVSGGMEGLAAISDSLSNGGRIEITRGMAGRSGAKAIVLHDHPIDDIGIGEVQKEEPRERLAGTLEL